MIVCIIGLGYIGLPTAALMAKHGHRVFGVDINSSTVSTINSGRIHIVENGLAELVRSVVENGSLSARTTPCEADAFVIAVPTPVHDDADHTPGLEFVDAAAESLVPYVRPGNMVILESTSPVGTTERIKDILDRHGVDTTGIHFAHCPERVIPGRALIELVENDRIIGGMTPEATDIVCALYRTFVKGELLKTNARTAEMTKLVENSFRDVNIAFANELSMICDDVGINVMELIGLANHHPRVNILTPGCGVGGHCIAVDPWFIVNRSPEQARLIRCAREENDRKSVWVVEKIQSVCRRVSTAKRPIVAVLGLSFKPDIDDLRNSPALAIARRLISCPDMDCRVVEPNIASHPEFSLSSYQDAVSGADVIVCLVAHRVFAGLPGRNPGAEVLNFCNLPVEPVEEA